MLDYAANGTTDFAVLKSGAESILYAWAGVSAVPATALGAGGFDARKLAFLESYAGTALMRRDSAQRSHRVAVVANENEKSAWRGASFRFDKQVRAGGRYCVSLLEATNDNHRINKFSWSVAA